MVLILSYNILAPPYCTPSHYPYTPLSIFRPEDRFRKIVEIIVNRDPDIFCLQEVTEHWSTKFIIELSLEWTIYFTPYGGPGEDRVGVLLAYKKSYQCLKINIFSPGLTTQDSRAKRYRNRLIVATFSGFSIATFHAPCTPHLHNFSLNYIREVERLIVENTNGKVLFAGDFNMLPTDPIYKVLFRLGWKSCIKTTLGEEKITNFTHTRRCIFRGTLDYILYKGGVQCVDGGVIGMTCELMPNMSCPSDHAPIWGKFKI